MMLIADIFNPHPRTIDPNVLVKEALRELIADDINGLIVTSEADHVLGVLSLQDIAAATVPRQFLHNARMAAAMYRKGFFSELCQELAPRKIKDIMRRDFVSVQLDDNIMTITADFLKNDLYIVPVIDKGKLIGVVTRTEIKDALAYGMGLSQHWTRHAGEKPGENKHHH